MLYVHGNRLSCKMFRSLDLLQLLQKGEMATEETDTEGNGIRGGVTRDERNENDVNRSKTANNKAREVIIEMKENDQREGVGD